MTRVAADLLLDLKYAARTITGQPSFACTVAVTLALGLALNAAVLGMMDALLLRPFQFADYPRLVVFFESPTGTAQREPVAPATYLHWRQQVRSTERLVAWESWGATLAGRTEPERLQAFRVSPGFFETLGIHPSFGRTFLPDEERTGNDRRVILGEGLWKRRFGGHPQVVGTELLLDSIPHTIVGIAPSGFDFPVAAELWVPLSFTPERAADRTNRSLTVLGKLTPGRSLDAARVELDVLAQQFAAQYPDTHAMRGATVRDLSSAFREDTAGSLVAVLQVGAGLVLLVACANLAGLLLARANDRQREFSIRTALGASRVRIVRQLVTEMVLLSLVSSIVALLSARVALEVLRTSVPADTARYIEGWNNVRLDGRLALVIPGFAMLIGLAVGLLPALSATRVNLAEGLKDGDRAATGGVRRLRARQALAVVEIALALTLLVAAGLTLDGAARMLATPSGFDSRSLLTLNIPLPENTYRDETARREFGSTLLARFETVPAVEGAAIANVLPAAGWSPTRRLLIEDSPEHDVARRPTPGYREVSTGYFETMRIPIVSGRSFSSVDRENGQAVAIVSEALARRYWPAGDPIGRRVQVGDSGPWRTIVGVAGDVTMYNWWDGIDYTAIYVPLRQSPPTGGLSVALRTRSEPSVLAGPVRAALASLDRQLAIDNMRSMEQAIAASTFGLDFMTILLGTCGAIALVLALVGIYSMMAYTVSQRRYEFGVRLALGATVRDVLGCSLRQAALLTSIGLVLGVALAATAAHFMSSALLGVIDLDLKTLAVVTAGLATVSLVAAYVPALRSTRIDPAAVLRSQ